MRRFIVIVVLLVASLFTATPANAWWHRHWGWGHHHWGYRGWGYRGWGGAGVVTAMAGAIHTLRIDDGAGAIHITVDFMAAASTIRLTIRDTRRGLAATTTAAVPPARPWDWVIRPLAC